MDVERIDGIVRAALEHRTAPGASYAIGGKHGILVRHFGRTRYDTGAAVVSDQTLWDLASLSKVVVTTSVAMHLFDAGILDLDEPIADLLVPFRGRGKAEVTARDLLLHNSGLPASHPSPTTFARADYLRRSVLGLDLAYKPRSATVYSDVGFIILGMALERVSGETLEALFRSSVLEKLGLQRTFFDPPLGARKHCAPTEAVEEWRAKLRSLRGTESKSWAEIECDSEGRRWITGEVHDPTAAVLGGTAPHAGLFATIDDLCSFVGSILNDSRIASRATIKLFTSRDGSSCSRALGWDTPSDGSSAGARFGSGSFGHTGFTGTSIWADPERDLYAILLTNRVHPSSDGQGIRELRVAFHDAVIDAADREAP